MNIFRTRPLKNGATTRGQARNASACPQTNERTNEQTRRADAAYISSSSSQPRPAAAAAARVASRRVASRHRVLKRIVRRVPVAIEQVETPQSPLLVVLRPIQPRLDRRVVPQHLLERLLLPHAHARGEPQSRGRVGVVRDAAVVLDLRGVRTQCFLAPSEGRLIGGRYGGRGCDWLVI
eukprot:30838-Pelagococcus_subviridis.AAC.10